MENTCILILDLEHSKKVIAYYKSLGVDNTEDLAGGCVGMFIGIFGGKFTWQAYPGQSRLIELPTEPILTFPRKMRVWDIDRDIYCNRTVIHDLGEGILNRYVALTIEEGNCNKKIAQFWWNAEDIVPPTLELTIDDIAKKYGVEPEQIKIIK